MNYPCKAMGMLFLKSLDKSTMSDPLVGMRDPRAMKEIDIKKVFPTEFLRWGPFPNVNQQIVT